MLIKSLVILGSGIKSIAHISTEAISYLKKAQKVLYLVNEPVMQEWIKKNNNNVESLDKKIDNNILRSEYYKKMTEHILENMQQYDHVCVIIYGHPTVFAKPALDAAIIAKKEGYSTKILPGISAEDCLFADLLIDPGSCGCQSYEATDLLIHERPLNIYSHLILWQVGVIGALRMVHSYNNLLGITQLTKFLMNFYNENHKIVIYEAAIYPHLEPRIKSCYLKKLPEMTLSTLSTLYVPPVKNAKLNHDMLKTLNINIKDLT